MQKYIFCDLEATGNRKHDRIIQLGLMVFEGSIKTSPIYIFHELNDTDVNITSEAMELHNITPNMIENKKKLNATTGYIKLNELNVTENIFIAHDAPSDLKMLKKEGFSNNMKVIDTLKCAKHFYDELNIHRLQFLRYELELYKYESIEANRLGMKIKAHDALSDILIMKLLLEKLMELAKNKYTLTSEQEILKKLIELSATPVMLKRFKFGKYKGEYINEIVQRDYGYIKWMQNTLSLDEDMEYTLSHYI